LNLELALVDSVILFVVITAVLWIGFHASEKVTSFQDYALSAKKYPTIPLALSFLATMIGAEDTVGDIQEMYDVGLVYVVPYLGYIFAVYLISKYIVPKFDGRFEGMVSVCDIMRHYFCIRVEKISSCFAIAAIVVLACAQLVALGHFISNMFDTTYTVAIFVIIFIITIYTSIGGVKSVVETDIIQFGMVLVIFPIICSVIIQNTGGAIGLLEQLSPQHKEIFSHPDFIRYLFLALVWATPFNVLYPQMVQRFLMAKNAKQISRITYSYIGILVLLMMITFLLAGSALILYQGQNINSNAILYSLIADYLPVGLKGMAVASIIGIIMSSIDSNLNAGAVLLTKNFFAVKSKEIAFCRFSTWVLGGIIFLISLYEQRVIDLIIICQGIVALGIGIPLFFALYDWNLTSLDYYIVIFTPIVMLPIYIWTDIQDYTYLFLLVVIPVVFLYVKHRKIRQKLWALVHDVKDIYQYCKKKLLSQIQFPTPKGIKTKDKGFIFGVIVVLNIIVPNIVWSSSTTGATSLVFLRLFVHFVALSFVLQFYWKDRFNKWYHIYWLFSLWLVLAFYPATIFILNSESTIWLSYYIMSLVLLLLLTGWQWFLRLFLSAFLVSMLISRPSSIDNIDSLLYAFTLFFIISVTLSRRKEEVDHIHHQQIEHMAFSIAHELKQPLHSIALYVALVKQPEVRRLMSEQIGAGLDIANRVLQVFEKQGVEEVIKDEYIQMSELIVKVLDESIFSMEVRGRMKLHVSADFICYANQNNLFVVIRNIVVNAANHSLMKDPSSKLDIYVEEEQLIFEDNGPGISLVHQSSIFNKFVSFNSDGMGTGLGLFYCKMELARIGGSIDCESELGKYTRFILKFPEINNGILNKKRGLT
jgi:Na+/proline symporter/signal transduction histidine kinase